MKDDKLEELKRRKEERDARKRSRELPDSYVELEAKMNTVLEKFDILMDQHITLILEHEKLLDAERKKDK